LTDRSEQLRAAFAARLERVRGQMTDGEFARLVADMVSTAARLEEINAREMGTTGPMPIPIFKEPEARTDYLLAALGDLSDPRAT